MVECRGVGNGNGGKLWTMVIAMVIRGLAPAEHPVLLKEAPLDPNAIGVNGLGRQ